MQVREALDEYLSARRRNLRPKTLSEVSRIIGYFSTFCEEQGIQLGGIKPRIMNDYLDILQATRHSKKGGPLSSQTVFLHVATIKVFLRWCAESEEFEECIKTTTVQRIPNPKKCTLILDTFSKEQIVSMLEACERVDVGSEKMNAYLRDRNRSCILLLLDTGIRASELCHLQMNSVFLSATDPHIRIVRGKGGKAREVGLGNRSREELERYVRKYRAKVRGSEEAYLFYTRRGDPLSEGTLFRIIRELGIQAKIKGVRCSPHTLRHTFAVFWMRAGGNLFQLSRLLGHSSTRTTESYLRSFTQQDSRRDAVSPVDQAF